MWIIHGKQAAVEWMSWVSEAILEVGKHAYLDLCSEKKGKVGKSMAKEVWAMVTHKDQTAPAF